jgi:CysZ protein
VLIALRNMLMQTFIIFACLCICWIPLIGWLSPLVVLVTGYYFYGFSMMDYVNERRQLGVRKSVAVIRNNRAGAITNGFIFSVVFALPVVGLIFAPVLAPVAACIAMLEADKTSSVYAKN